MSCIRSNCYVQLYECQTQQLLHKCHIQSIPVTGRQRKGQNYCSQYRTPIHCSITIGQICFHSKILPTARVTSCSTNKIPYPFTVSSVEAAVAGRWKSTRRICLNFAEFAVSALAGPSNSPIPVVILQTDWKPPYW